MFFRCCCGFFFMFVYTFINADINQTENETGVCLWSLDETREVHFTNFVIFGYYNDFSTVQCSQTTELHLNRVCDWVCVVWLFIAHLFNVSSYWASKRAHFSLLPSTLSQFQNLMKNWIQLNWITGVPRTRRWLCALCSINWRV